VDVDPFTTNLHHHDAPELQDIMTATYLRIIWRTITSGVGIVTDVIPASFAFSWRVAPCVRGLLFIGVLPLWASYLARTHGS
jgi:ABC-type spermidine/putrescine transport system permease subunit I